MTIEGEVFEKPDGRVTAGRKSDHRPVDSEFADQVF